MTTEPAVLDRSGQSQQSWRQWPRLYLDSAILLEIADGELNDELLSRLLATMADPPKLLAVSRDHMQDVMTRSDGNRDRFATAVERFPFRAVVDREPHDIEPWTNGPEDIGLWPIEGFAELLKQPGAAPQLAKLATAQDQLHAASSMSQALRRAQPLLSPKANELAMQCLITLMRGWMGTDVSEILAMWEADSAPILSETERSALVKLLTPWSILLRDFEREHSPTDDDRERLLRGFRDGFDDASREHSPGMFLARRLSGCWYRKVDRKPRRGDSVDGMHASYFPYVDVATCDASAYACLAPYVGPVKGSRHPLLFKNADLAAAVDAIASLISHRPHF